MNSASELPSFFYPLGIAMEIAIGSALLMTLIQGQKMTRKMQHNIISATSVALITMMTVAFYVHFHPDIPGEVLPMQIKPPVVPGMFMLFAIVNLLASRKFNRLP